MLLNIFRQYQNTKQKKVWCHENFLHYRNLQYGSEVRQQLAALAERANLESASCGTNTEQLRKALLEGLYENLAELQRDGTYVTVSKRFDADIITSAPLYFPTGCCLRSRVISRVLTPCVLYERVAFFFSKSKRDSPQ